MDDVAVQSLPDDPQALKAMVLTLVRERDAATQERDAATRERDAATRREQQAQLKAQQLELEKLRLAHQLEQLKKRYYGPRADKLEVGQFLLEFAVALEKRPVNPDDLAAEGAAQAAAAVASDMAQQVAVRRIKRGRRDIGALDKLPMVRQVHDLDEEEKHCDRGHPLVKIGEEITWQVEYFPGYFARIQHVQIKYGCTQHCEPNGDNPQITLAPKPPAPIDKGMAGPGLLAYVITSKFADHLPLYRLESIFGRNGLEIDRSTMSVWAGDVADLIKPLHELMIQRLLLSHVIGTDDTIMPMLAAEKTRQARMWIYQGDEEHPYNLFDFTLSRSRDGPALFLKKYDQILLADAYGGYEGICIEKEMIQAGCWSHARRKFVDAQKLAPPIAIEALELIGNLFAIEERAKSLSHADRLALRQAQSATVLQQLYQRLGDWKQQLLPRHPMAEAIGYVLNQWGPLTAFLADGAIPIHNNLAEQQMKRIALGRKNYLFVGNERGGRTAAILSSITSTCRRHDIDPQRYLTQLLTNLPATPMSQLQQWLPDVWKRRQGSGVGADAHTKA
jgi:transposase